MIEAIQDLRRLVPDFDRAWYAAQRDEMQEDPDKQVVYAVATSLVQAVTTTLTGVAREAEPDLIALGLTTGPDGRQEMRRLRIDHPAVHFYLECFEAVATFKYWAAEGDFGPLLDRVELACIKWLHDEPTLPMNDNVRRAIAESRKAERESKASVAEVKLAQRGQQRGNSRAASDRKSRQRAAWNVFGLPGPSAPSLLARINGKATSDQIAQLADIYGYSDVDAFVADAQDRSSTLRYHLKRDNK